MDVMNNWRALLLPYQELDLALRHRRWLRRRYHHVLSEQELEDSVASYRALPSLVADLTDGRIELAADIRDPLRPLTTLTDQGAGFFWPSPDDVRLELDQFAPRGSYDSIFVFWPQRDTETHTNIPCRGWGLGMGPSYSTNGATYAVVGNAPSWAWTREAPGEVWLHEWLHGVCQFFGSRGYRMPERDADGAEVCGYARSQSRGWTEYYRDLMNCRVADSGAMLGIPRDAWHSAQPRFT